MTMTDPDPMMTAPVNPMVAPTDVPPDQWPVDTVATIEILQNSPSVMGARLVASKMSHLLATGQPVVLSEDDQRIVDEAKAQAGAPPVIDPPAAPEPDPDMQPA